MQAHAQTLDPFWRNGFYVVTGLTLEQRQQIVNALRHYP